MKFITSSLLVTIILGTMGCTIFQKSTEPLPRPEMVYVKAGTFLMGDIFDSSNNDALPVHTTNVTGFYIEKYEVTFSNYNAFAKRTNYGNILNDSLLTGNQPAIQVSWNDALAYCKYFGYRLPSEMEWEYAARSAGKRDRFSGTSNPDSLSYYANVNQEHIDKPLPVGLKKPNGLGLYDMSGNVFEWIGDYYQFYPENGQEPDWDSLDQRKLRIIRGGSFHHTRAVAATYWRAAMLNGDRASIVGFRCATDEK